MGMFFPNAMGILCREALCMESPWDYPMSAFTHFCEFHDGFPLDVIQNVALFIFFVNGSWDVHTDIVGEVSM